MENNNIKIVRINNDGVIEDSSFKHFDNTEYRGKFGAKERRSLDDLQDYEGDVFVLNEELTLKEWSDSNHLYLTKKELKNVEKYLKELSEYNYKRNAEESWKQYIEDQVLYVTPTKQNKDNHVIATEEDFPTQRTLEEMLGKRGRAEVILDKIKHTGDINEINELTKELNKQNKNNINGVEKK